MKVSTVSIDLTPAEHQALKEKQRRTEVAFHRMAAAATPEGSDGIARQWWSENIDRPRAQRRVHAARRMAPAPACPTRFGRVTVKRRARRVRTATPSRGDPDDDPDPPGEQTWALTFVDRAPVFWRLRAAHCRYMEWREGVDR